MIEITKKTYNIKDKTEKEVISLDKNITYILLNPYTKNPEISFERACLITQFLRSQHEVLVFSPVLHTHGYNRFLQKHHLEYEEDYYEWDLQLYTAFKDPKALIFTDDYAISKGCKMEMVWAKKHNLPIFFIEEPSTR